MRVLTRTHEKEAAPKRSIFSPAPYFAVRTPEGNTLRFDTWDQVERYEREVPVHMRHKVLFQIVA